MKSTYRVNREVLRNRTIRIWTTIVCIIGLCIISINLIEPIRGFLLVRSITESDAAVAAENQYCIMEENLRIHLQNYETLHPDYNEYHYELAEIEHEPYVLVSILSAVHGDNFSFAEIQSTLAQLFEEQYVLSEEILKKKRYVKGVEVDYYICTVRLDNHDLAQISTNIMDHEQFAIYKDYLRYFERDTIHP